MSQQKIPKKSDINTAELKAAITLKKTLSLKRLEHDYNEIKNQIIKIPSVTARPLDDNFYEWHGNIKCLKDNIYKGAVLHLKFVFPKNYPLSPPDVYVMNTNIIHPNVLSDGKICLDILEKNTKDEYIGWRSGYTVLSILSQLQNFFFDIKKVFLIEENEEKREIEKMKKEEEKEKDKKKKKKIKKMIKKIKITKKKRKKKKYIFH